MVNGPMTVRTAVIIMIRNKEDKLKNYAAVSLAESRPVDPVERVWPPNSDIKSPAALRTRCSHPTNQVSSVQYPAFSRCMKGGMSGALCSNGRLCHAMHWA